MVLPSWAGDMLTTTPALWRAAIFSLAPPFPPAMMAPAWPIRRPGGAVSPAMKDTTGLALGPWEERNVLHGGEWEEKQLQVGNCSFCVFYLNNNSAGEVIKQLIQHKEVWNTFSPDNHHKPEANRNFKSFYRHMCTIKKKIHYKYCYRNKILKLTVLLSSSQKHRIWLERKKSTSPTNRFNLENTLNSFSLKKMTV